MMTSSNGYIFYVSVPLWAESNGHRWIPSPRSVTRNVDVFFDLRLNKRLSKQSRRQSVRRHGAHYDVTVMVCIVDEVQYPNSSEWVNEWLSLMVFLVTLQRGACNSYKPCNHDLYMMMTLRLTALYHFYKEGIANSASQHSQSLCPCEYNEAGHPFPQRLR